MARSWQDLAKILQEPAGLFKDHGKILAKSWQDLGTFMARSCGII